MKFATLSQFWAIACVSIIALLALPTWLLADTPAQKLYRSVEQSVVTVTAGDSVGTGFLVKNSRTIVTAAHVIESGDVPVIQFKKGSYLAVKSMIVSRALDLAILVTVDEMAAKPLPLGDREVVTPGAQVFAIGTALGALQHTLTDGMLSGLRQSGSTDLIQVSAPFSPGMSGGPVLTTDGKVLGVISFSFERGQNVNIAVSAKHVRELLAETPRDVEVVLAQLKRSQTAGESSSSSSETPPPSPPRNDNSAQLADARLTALADLCSETYRWAWSAADDFYRIYWDSDQMEDWRQVSEANDFALKSIPLITVGGRVFEKDISGRVSAFCTSSEFGDLSSRTLAISRALNEASDASGKAIIERHSRVSTAEKRKAAHDALVRTTSRIRELVHDFNLYIGDKIGSHSELERRASTFLQSGCSIYFGVMPDQDRPTVPAVKWSYPGRPFKPGDVIVSLKVVGGDPAVSISSWADVDRFVSAIRGKEGVKVGLRGGREEVIVIEK